ncbi:MAG: hypothetical protein HKP27_12090, partial [Myxococcales bacterium]|nr:hypothetical protein [Myxococcales bacterium]
GDAADGQLELWRASDATAGSEQPTGHPPEAPAGGALLEALRALEIETLTPLEALNVLDRLARDARRTPSDDEGAPG